MGNVTTLPIPKIVMQKMINRLYREKEELQDAVQIQAELISKQEKIVSSVSNIDFDERLKKQLKSYLSYKKLKTKKLKPIQKYFIIKKVLSNAGEYLIENNIIIKAIHPKNKYDYYNYLQYFQVGCNILDIPLTSKAINSTHGTLKARLDLVVENNITIEYNVPYKKHIICCRISPTDQPNVIKYEVWACEVLI